MKNAISPNGWWVTGMIDGEGCFVAGIHKPSAESRRGQEQLGIQFRLVQRADDLYVGKLLLNYFGCGKLHFRTEKMGNDSYVFVMSSKSEMSVLLNHLRQYPLQSKKQNDLKFWIPIVQHYLSGNGLWKERMTEISRLCDGLKAIRHFDKTQANRVLKTIGDRFYRGGKRTWRFHDLICKKTGCFERHYGRGYCQQHYFSLIRNPERRLLRKQGMARVL